MALFMKSRWAHRPTANAAFNHSLEEECYDWRSSLTLTGERTQHDFSCRGSTGRHDFP
jgi:hypothetical protein